MWCRFLFFFVVHLAKYVVRNICRSNRVGRLTHLALLVVRQGLVEFPREVGAAVVLMAHSWHAVALSLSLRLALPVHLSRSKLRLLLLLGTKKTSGDRGILYHAQLARLSPDVFFFPFLDHRAQTTLCFV